MASTQRWGFRAAALALLGAGWLWVWWSEREARETPVDAPAPVAPAPAEALEAPPRAPAVMAAPSAGEVQRVAVATEEPEAGAEAPRPAQAEGQQPAVAEETGIRVEGTLVVTDPDGAEHAGESGRMSLVVWEGKAGRSQRVEISAGRWTADVPAGAELSFEKLAPGGRLALADGERRIPIPASRQVAVRAHWPPASLLRVRSAQTGQELSGIELALHREMGFGFPVPDHPGTRPWVVAEDATSPVDLGLALGGRDVGRGVWLYARAEGFAWGLIKLDLEAGGERVLELVPGGGLRVALKGEMPRGANLRLRRLEESTPRPLELAVYRKLEHQFTSLLPGIYEVSVEMGEWHEASLVLGSSQAEVVAGAVAEVAVQVARPPEVATAPLRGTLRVHSSWGAVEPAIRIESIDAAPETRKHVSYRELLPAGSGAWTFDAGPVPYGNYEIKVEPLYLFLQRVDATTGDLWIEIAAPAVAAVRVVDGDGLEVKELDTLGWSPVRSDDARVGAFASVGRDPASGRFEIRAPPGRISVFVHEHEVSGDATFDLAPGRNELELVVQWSRGFSLVLREGDTAIPSPWADWAGEIPELSGAGELTGMSGGAGGVWLLVSSPGLYRFTLAPVDGYEPIPEQQVLVPERGFVEHVVQLVRSP